jgi:hypothetical protein
MSRIAMPPSSSAALDKILEYTVVAANGLQQVAGLTQIPFLDRICTLALIILPMVQVRHLRDMNMLWSSSQVIEHQVSEGAMPPDRRGHSSFTLPTDELIHPLGGHALSQNAQPDSRVHIVSLGDITTYS